MYPVLSVNIPCRGLHTCCCALGLPDRHYLAINQRDGPQPSLVWTVPSISITKGQKPVFSRKTGNNWVADVIKNSWYLKLLEMLEKLEMMPTCHSLRTEGCPSQFSGPASVGVEGQVQALMQNQPPAGGKEIVCHQYWQWQALIFSVHWIKLLFLQSFFEEFPPFSSSHHLLALSFCQ